MHSITAVCDVRSHPYSTFIPQFNRETIKKELEKYGIAYVFLGKELRPRSDDPACYVDGKVQYDCLAKTDLFHQGAERLRKEMIGWIWYGEDPAFYYRLYQENC